MLIPQSKRDVPICTHDDLNNLNITANLKFQFPWAKSNRKLDLALECLHQLTNGAHLLPVRLVIWQLAKMRVQKVEQKVRESVTWSYFQLACHPSCPLDIHTHSSLYCCIIPWQPVAYWLLRRLLLNARCCDVGLHANLHLYHANAKLAWRSGYHQAVALWWIIHELKLLQLWSHNFYSRHWPIQPSDQCAGSGRCRYSLIWHICSHHDQSSIIRLILMPANTRPTQTWLGCLRLPWAPFVFSHINVMTKLFSGSAV